MELLSCYDNFNSLIRIVILFRQLFFKNFTLDKISFMLLKCKTANKSNIGMIFWLLIVPLIQRFFLILSHMNSEALTYRIFFTRYFNSKIGSCLQQVYLYKIVFLKKRKRKNFKNLKRTPYRKI